MTTYAGNKYGFCAYVGKYIKARDLKEGTEIFFLAFRGNYDGCNNINNVWIEIRGTIKILDTGERRVIPNKEDVKKYKKKTGKEQYDQAFPYFLGHNEKITKVFKES